MAAAAAVAALAPSAQAHNNFPASYAAECANPFAETNTPLIGIGASFQASAQLAWGADLVGTDGSTYVRSDGNGFASSVAGCNPLFADRGLNNVGNLRYRSEGSGAGRTAFGATGTLGAARNATVAFGGVDEPPTVAQLDSANIGPDATRSTADDDTLHTIPNAQGAVAILLRIPDNCQIDDSLDVTGNLRRLGRAQVDNAFAARTAADTWGELTQNRIRATTGGGLTDAQCRAKNFSRVVRSDSSGTTFQFKRYLAAVGVSGEAWAAYANIDWPARSSTVNPIASGSGNGGVLTQINNDAAHGANGAIAYADLATARSGGFGWDGTHADRKIWAHVQRISDNAFRSPAVNDPQAGTRGANCARVEYNDYTQESDPANNGPVLPTTVDSWFEVDAVRTTENYPICTLTYALTFEHPGTQAFGTDPAWTTARSRARVSYVNYVVGTSGQGVLPGADYDRLPAAVQTVAQSGVANLGD